MKTTLNKIREHGPCGIKPEPDGTLTGLCKLMAHLGKTTTDDEPVDLLTILESNGFDDALWCLRAVDGYEREIRLFAVACARDVEHLTDDPRVKECNDVAERFANGLATAEELAKAREAARGAARWASREAARWPSREAAWAAREAAWAATEEAALGAAEEAALEEKQKSRFIAMCEANP